MTVFFQCRPLRLVWDGTMDGYCLPASHLKFAAYFNSSEHLTRLMGMERN